MTVKKGLIVVPALYILASALMFSAVASAKTTLKFTLWLNNADEIKGTKALVEQYEKKTGVKVDVIYSGWDGYFDKLLTMIASGNTPDVMVVSRVHLPRLAQNKLVRPLTDFNKASRFDPKKSLSDWKSGTYRGEFYGFPVWGGPYMMFYNPVLFQQVGLQEPYQYVAAKKWNWDTLINIGQKLTIDRNGDGKKDQFALSQETWGTNVWVSMVRQAGGEVVNDDYSKALIDQPKAIDGLTFWQDLAWRYNIAPKSTDKGPTVLNFGWLASSVTGAIASQKRKIETDMVIPPAGPAGYSTISGGCPISISRASKHQKEAYDFAKWFALESDDWKIIGGPASRKTFESDYQDYLKKYFKHSNLASMALDSSSLEPLIHPKSTDLDRAMVDMGSRLGDNKLSPRTAAESLAKVINQILKK